MAAVLQQQCQGNRLHQVLPLNGELDICSSRRCQKYGAREFLFSFSFILLSDMDILESRSLSAYDAAAGIPKANW
ncbi:hypothetical protein NC651_010325 [Populus alba x Populus x berolinensis]|nr:hypothetical protein NC651_010325 [Populus alba x Populus x berolinensis]